MDQEPKLKQNLFNWRIRFCYLLAIWKSKLAEIFESSAAYNWRAIVASLMRPPIFQNPPITAQTMNLARSPVTVRRVH